MAGAGSVNTTKDTGTWPEKMKVEGTKRINGGLLENPGEKQLNEVMTVSQANS